VLRRTTLNGLQAERVTGARALSHAALKTAGGSVAVFPGRTRTFSLATSLRIWASSGIVHGGARSAGIRQLRDENWQYYPG